MHFYFFRQQQKKRKKEEICILVFCCNDKLPCCLSLQSNFSIFPDRLSYFLLQFLAQWFTKLFDVK